MAIDRYRSAYVEAYRSQKLILGIDRLDPTKGLVQRLYGFRRLLETRPDWRRNVTLLQIAAESRTDVSAYQDLRVAIDAEAGAINSEWGEPDWTPTQPDCPGRRPSDGGRLYERGSGRACHAVCVTA